MTLSSAVSRLNGQVVSSEQIALTILAADRSPRYVFGIVGRPGSGKTTAALEIVRHLNKVAGQNVAVMLPMDGFHYYRSELDQMQDPAEAHRRRGAAFTFNSQMFSEKLKSLRSGGQTIAAPHFDHAAKDPEENKILIEPYHRFVIVEGLYLLMDTGHWKTCRESFDAVVFLDDVPEVANGRLVKRHVATGVGRMGNRSKPTTEQAWIRINESDARNGDEVDETKNRATAVLKWTGPSG